MDWSRKKVDYVTLLVEDLDRTKAFYQDVFNLPLTWEDESSFAFHFENTGINVVKASVAAESLEPAKVGSPDGPRFLFTIEVDDIDAVCEELAKHNVTFVNGPVDRPWGMRSAYFADPGGHFWEVSGPLKD